MPKLPPAPKSTTHGVRQTMKANRRRDTKAELAVRRRLHQAGARYRVDFAPDSRDKRRKADIVFTRAKIAVYIDGCFWHGCPDHFIEPKSNLDYWRPKIEGNKRRDLETTASLVDLGWQVLRFWEHEDPDGIVRRILHILASRDASHPMNASNRRGSQNTGFIPESKL